MVVYLRMIVLRNMIMMKGVINMFRFSHYRNTREYLVCMIMDVVLLFDTLVSLLTLGIVRCDYHSEMCFDDDISEWVEGSN